VKINSKKKELSDLLPHAARSPREEMCFHVLTDAALETTQTPFGGQLIGFLSREKFSFASPPKKLFVTN
jgi:hypothetical protein